MRISRSFGNPVVRSSWFRELVVSGLSVADESLTSMLPRVALE